MSRSIVIADASCLIALDNINEINILRGLYQEILVTPKVSSEFGKPLPSWVYTKAPANFNKQLELEKILDAGEASSIALALESPYPLLIIDEKKGRRVASELEIEIIGTVGVILEAGSAGLIEVSTDLINRLEKAHFRISSDLRTKLLSNRTSDT